MMLIGYRIETMQYVVLAFEAEITDLVSQIKSKFSMDGDQCEDLIARRDDLRSRVREVNNFIITKLGS